MIWFLTLSLLSLVCIVIVSVLYVAKDPEQALAKLAPQEQSKNEIPYGVCRDMMVNQDESVPTQRRIAICMRGAVAKVSGRFPNPGELYYEGDYVDYRRCYRSIQKHIVDANPLCTFDFFLHCWNTDLEQNLTSIYQPKAYLFEDNNLYAAEILRLCNEPNDYGGISSSLSMQKVLTLKRHFSEKAGVHYDQVILYRYDVLLWKDMLLHHYDTKDGSVFCNRNGAAGSCSGDFHFIMSDKQSQMFEHLYATIGQKLVHQEHHWISRYVTEHMRVNIVADTIVAGKDQEVIRKIQDTSG